MSRLSKPGITRVRRNVEKALYLLYRNDHFLIINGTQERSITHKLAEYIQQQFPGWHVDCEYNRRGQRLPKAILSQDTSYPDIIVHHRNTRENLLVIEAKSIHSQDHSDAHDKKKVKAYIEDSDYQYQFGLWVCFYDDPAESQLDWFENLDGDCCEVSS
jgi:hypothetical protein